MLDQNLAEFLQQGLAIHIGTRNQKLEPNGCRVTAVRVEDEGRSLIAYLPKAATPEVLQDLRANGQAAVSFARPVDDRAVQIKGVFESVKDADPAEQQFVVAQWEAFLKQLDMIGLPGVSTRTWQMWPCVAVRIRITALFNQTPGPDAGATLS
jgi:hypothetical protein